MRRQASGPALCWAEHGSGAPAKEREGKAKVSKLSIEARDAKPETPFLKGGNAWGVPGLRLAHRLLCLRLSGHPRGQPAMGSHVRSRASHVYILVGH